MAKKSFYKLLFLASKNLDFYLYLLMLFEPPSILSCSAKYILIILLICKKCCSLSERLVQTICSHLQHFNHFPFITQTEEIKILSRPSTDDLENHHDIDLRIQGIMRQRPFLIICKCNYQVLNKTKQWLD